MEVKPILINKEFIDKLNKSDIPILLIKNLKKYDYYLKSKNYDEFMTKFDEDEINFYITCPNDKNKYKSNLKKILFCNPFISIRIVYEFERSDIVCLYYKFMNNDIYIYHKINDNLDIDINLICYYIKFVKKIFNNKKKLTLRILLSNCRKKLTSKILSKRNVNSGSCDGYNINIWRREELLKVLIHELIHFCKGDLDILNGYDGHIKKLYPVEGLIRPNEAYTEALTIIIYGIIRDENLKTFINKQIKHSKKQWVKILNHIGSNPISFRNNNTEITLVQNTAVLSYYYLKMNLLRNYMKWIYTPRNHELIFSLMIEDDFDYKDVPIPRDKYLRLTF